MIVRVIFKHVLFHLDSRYHLCMLLDESNQRRIRGCLIISREHLPGFTFYHQQKVLLDCPKTSAIVIEYRALVLRPFAELSSIWGQWGFQVSRYLCNIVLNFSRKISPQNKVPKSMKATFWGILVNVIISVLFLIAFYSQPTLASSIFMCNTTLSCDAFNTNTKSNFFCQSELASFYINVIVFD